MQEKLIIFDCDGVLVDSEFISSKIFSEAMTAYGYQISIEESIRRFTGVSATAARQAIMEEALIHFPENYWALQQQNLFKAFQTELKALQKPFLEMLSANKISRCVASNSSKKHIFECLEFSQQYSFFDKNAIFSAEQVARGKPSPDVFLLASQEMGFEPDNCIVIEDSLAGIEAALAANMQVIAFLGGQHASYDWYRQNIQKYQLPIVHSSQELLEAIQSW